MELRSLCFILLMPALAFSQPAVRLITAAELSQSLAQSVVLDARPAADYRKSHIPGSYSVDWKNWTEERPDFFHSLVGDPKRWGAVPRNPEKIKKLLAPYGIVPKKSVVVLGSPGVFGEEGRIAWSLLYWGIEPVQLLDGGIQAWKAAGFPLEQKIPAAAPSQVEIKLDESRRVRLDEMEKIVKSGDRLILDSRSEEEYRGKRMPGQKRGGHLPNAKLIPLTRLYTSEGHYLSAEALRQEFKELPKNPVAYCTGGVRSALLVLLLEARLGIKGANYDGSMWEWAAHQDLPIDLN